MVTVTGVRFKPAGKVYYFNPGTLKLKEGDYVIVETARGLEFGEVMTAPRKVNEKSIIKPLKKVVRIADAKDCSRHERNMSKKKSTMDTCQQRINAHNLDMKLVDVEFTFDNSKVIFYFTSDGRVDFRELVKDLAGIFKMRIELRQVGVRDEAKMLGGIGNCGRGLCCHTWLPDFNPVSIKMAKMQGLSLNPTKISGICGRLMCCLKYENDAYVALKRGLPDAGERVRTPDGIGIVVENNILREQVKVRLVLPPDKNTPPGEDHLDADISVYKKKDIKRLEKSKKKKHQNDNDELETLSEDMKSILRD